MFQQSSLFLYSCYLFIDSLISLIQSGCHFFLLVLKLLNFFFCSDKALFDADKEFLALIKLFVFAVQKLLKVFYSLSQIGFWWRQVNGIFINFFNRLEIINLFVGVIQLLLKSIYKSFHLCSIYP